MRDNILLADFSGKEREWRHFLILILWGALFLAAVTFLYFTFAHPIIEDIYRGQSLRILNKLIAGQGERSLGSYIQSTDRYFWRVIIPQIFATFYFWYVFLRVLVFIFGKIKSDLPLIPTESQRLFKYDWLAAVAIYSILTIIYFFPFLKGFSDHLIGPAEDNMMTYWNLWWGHRVFFEGGGSLTFCSLICYPQGVSLYYQAYSFYNLFLSLPLTSLFGLAASYNLLIMHSFPLAGLGAFLLIRYLTRNSWLALFGGFMYAFAPYHIARALHHVNINSLQFVPFFILFFIRAVKEKGAGNVIWAALFFLLNALCDWNFMIFAGYFVLFSYIYLAIRRKRIVLRDLLIKGSLIVLPPLAVLSPWLVHMIVPGLHTDGITAIGHDNFVTDPLGVFFPSQYHLLAQLGFVKSAIRYVDRYSNPWEAALYLGIPALVVTIASFRYHFSRIAKYFVGFLAMFIMGAGCHLHILGTRLAIDLPYEIIVHIPFLSNVRAPSRFFIYAIVFWIIIVAVGLNHLYEKWKGRKYGRYLFAGLMVLLAVDFYSYDSAQTEVKVPACYDLIKNEPGRWGVLDLPSGYAPTAQYMMNQTFHHLPIVQGYVSRKLGPSLIDSLEMNDLAVQKKQLMADRVKYIVIHREYPEADSLDLNLYRTIYEAVADAPSFLMLKVY
ncbi:membrane hypothetical protein [Candidatus Zixiibacteriota bacterium]|nr:membrane hypothetical protein [candidate division Zixibacteria bacterium]